jgi:hypothetical protein
MQYSVFCLHHQNDSLNIWYFTQNTAVFSPIITAFKLQLEGGGEGAINKKCVISRVAWSHLENIRGRLVTHTEFGQLWEK